MTFQAHNKILIAYFSHSSNTQKIAQQIPEQIGGIIVKIEPVNNLPLIYNEVLIVAKKEIRLGRKPDLRNFNI